jgi:hypothetical protein
MSIAALIEAVEAGTDQLVLELSYQFGGNYVRVVDAFRGSLDAAKALHEALLPGCYATLSSVGDATIFGNVSVRGISWAELSYAEAATPARAWLLAILRAKEAGQ